MNYKIENLRKAIHFMQGYAEYCKEPILDREIKMAKDFMSILKGEETVESLTVKIKARTDELNKKHPIISRLYDFFHPTP